MSSGASAFPAIGQAAPPPQSPQQRERCPQNMFDPILRASRASQKSVTLRYRTRLIGFTQDAERVTATVENADTGAREQIAARYLVGCDGARSLVRETLGITMRGNPALTYTTNVIFRCPDLLSLHDKGKAYRLHSHRAGRHLGDRRGDQRPRPVALFAYRQLDGSANTRRRRSRPRSAAPSAAISSSRF